MSTGKQAAEKAVDVVIIDDEQSILGVDRDGSRFLKASGANPESSEDAFGGGGG